MTRIFWDTIFLISGPRVFIVLRSHPFSGSLTLLLVFGTSYSMKHRYPVEDQVTWRYIPVHGQIPGAKPSGTFSMSVILNGSLFTFGAGPSNTTMIDAHVSIDTNSTVVSNTSISSLATNSSARSTTLAPTTDTPMENSSLFTFEAGITDTEISTNPNSSEAPYISKRSSATTSRSTTNATTATTTTSIPPVKKFVAAAVRSHFDDCPDSHRHFCFHGTCRFLILEETPACVCHSGFVGMRCEHADLLAVVAADHRQQTVATMLVLCVIGCVLIMVLCTLLHCWWRQDCRRRSHAHHYTAEKHGASCYPSESVV